MSVAFLFPGQGIDPTAVGRDWLERSFAVRELLEVAATAVGMSPAAVFDGGGRVLSRTEVLQPVLTALCLGIHRELRATGIRPRFVAGHSLGEIPACAAAGLLEDRAAVELAALRGRLMACEAERRAGGMLALLGVSPKAVEDALTLGASGGEVQLAAWNAPDEAVVAGSKEALRRIAAEFRSVPLNVAGAWHGPGMAPAVELLRQALRRAVRSRPDAILVCNRSGQAVDDLESVPDLLAEQLVRPIQWAATMRTMAEAGVSHFVTIGPGRVLRGLLRKSLGPKVLLLGTESPADFSCTVEATG